MRKKSRLFAIAEALRGRRTGVTAEALAAQFDVTVRTVYRDLAALQEAGLPLLADRGPGGGYALDKSYQLPPVNFTAREAAMLVVLANAAIAQRLLPFTDTLSQASNKVRAALSTSAQRELLAHIRDLQIVAVPTLPVPAAVRRAIETTWFEHRVLRIMYCKTNGEASPRLVRIRNIVCERTQTLLNCDDVEQGVSRQFRLDRVTAATLM